MGFVEWWKKSSSEASVNHEALRFDRNELSEIRQGFLSPSAKQKISRRVNRQNKITNVLAFGCLTLALLILLPFSAFFVYSFICQPQSRTIVTLVFGVFITFVIIFAAIIFWLKNKHQNQLRADLSESKIICQTGQLKIRIETGGHGINKHYSVKDVEFLILEDFIGAEIHRQFLNPLISVADSRETVESYRFYYLPQTKLLLHYENEL